MANVKIESFPWDDHEAVKNQIEELEAENSMLHHELKRLNNIAHKRLKANNAAFAWGVAYGVFVTILFVISFINAYGVRP